MGYPGVRTEECRKERESKRDDPCASHLDLSLHPQRMQCSIATPVPLTFVNPASLTQKHLQLRN